MVAATENKNSTWKMFQLPVISWLNKLETYITFLITENKRIVHLQSNVQIDTKTHYVQTRVRLFTNSRGIFQNSCHRGTTVQAQNYKGIVISLLCRYFEFTTATQRVCKTLNSITSLFCFILQGIIPMLPNISVSIRLIIIRMAIGENMHKNSNIIS